MKYLKKNPNNYNYSRIYTINRTEPDYKERQTNPFFAKFIQVDIHLT